MHIALFWSSLWLFQVAQRAHWRTSSFPCVFVHFGASLTLHPTHNPLTHTVYNVHTPVASRDSCCCCEPVKHIRGVSAHVIRQQQHQSADENGGNASVFLLALYERGHYCNLKRHTSLLLIAAQTVLFLFKESAGCTPHPPPPPTESLPLPPLLALLVSSPPFSSQKAAHCRQSCAEVFLATPD